MKSTLIVYTLLLFIVGCYAACDNDWASFGSKCYQRSSESVTWENAKKGCESKNSHLAKIESAEENKFLLEKYLDIPPGKVYSEAWIGLSDKHSEGEFRWTDNTIPKYTNWGPDQPNDELNGQDCGFIGHGIFELGGPNFKGTWVDFQCDFLLKYVCEKKAK